MHEVWFFYPHNCKRWLVTEVDKYVGLPNVVVNPDLSEIKSKKVKPHHWKCEDGKIVEKTEEEKAISDAWHKKNVQSNPTVITVEKEVTRTILREVPVEVSVDREVIKYKIPGWIHLIYGTIIGFITIILVK